MTDKTGGPAFPCAEIVERRDGQLVGAPHSGPGMTLRDYFAGQALAGDLAAQNELTGEYTSDISGEFLEKRAKFFYRFADAMIKARAEQ